MGCNLELAESSEATAPGAVALSTDFHVPCRECVPGKRQIDTNEESAIAIKDSLSHMCYCTAGLGSEILRMEDGATSTLLSRLPAARRHPNVIQLKEVFLTTKYLGIAMEYADGGDVSQFIDEQSARGVRYSKQQQLWESTTHAKEADLSQPSLYLTGPIEVRQSVWQMRHEGRHMCCEGGWCGRGGCKMAVPAAYGGAGHGASPGHRQSGCQGATAVGVPSLCRILLPESLQLLSGAAVSFASLALTVAQ